MKVWCTAAFLDPTLLVETGRACEAAGFSVEHDGRHYRHERLTLRPVPPAPIPIYVGGESDAALRRAASADGWIGSLYADGDLEGHLARLAAARRAAGATGDHEVIVTLPRAIYDLERYRRLRDHGVTGVMCAPWMSARDVGGPSMTKVRERLQRYADQVITRL